MALNELRQTVTIDSLLRKVGNIIEAASNNAYTAGALADELCGPTPALGEQDGRGEKAIGKLDVLDALLDSIAEHQRRTRHSLGRLDGVIREDRAETAGAGSKVSY